MRMLRQALTVARLEAAILRRFPRLWVAVLGIVLVPALYAFICLESVWDTASRTSALPALIVNEDRGTAVGEQRVHIGAELALSLRERARFGYRELTDPEAARRAVQRGEAVFALLIPQDFSASAMSAQSPGAGRLLVVTSEGNNYVAAGLARRFAAELGHEVNEALAARRWSAVLGATASSSDSLLRLREGATRLREGAIALERGVAQAHEGAARTAEGNGRLATGVGALADGARQLGTGVRALDARRPAAADLQALKSGAAQLAAGHAQWQAAVAPLDDGARRLHEGLLSLNEGVVDIPFYGTQLVSATSRLGEGAAQLQAGVRAASEGQARLGAGAQSVAAGAAQVAEGFGAYAAGVSALAARLPAEAAVDEVAAGGLQLAQAGTQLRDGLGQLRASATQLAAGVDTLARALPDAVEGPAGTPEGLAMTVQPRLEIDAPVAQEGLGFAPNFIPVALWLGAAMAAFVFPLRQVPRRAQGSSSLAVMLGKTGLLGGMTAAQALVVLLMVCTFLELRPVHAAGLALAMVASSLTFMLVVLLLVRAFGDVGKALTLLLLVLQLSSSGGVTPIELTNDFFRMVSPWLPFTWSVKALRASAFGAFGGEWVAATGMLLLFALAAFMLSVRLGRWRFVPDEAYRPALDLER